MTAASIRIVLAGNPNCGKTSLFNGLTGSRQHVGNYAGVTVEKRSGTFVDVDGRRVEVLDLPGTYSLSSYSPEERITQDELLAGSHEVVAAVVDSTNLRRGLVLLVQLMQLTQPGQRRGDGALVLCLNMSDEAERAGQRIDRELLEQLLGFPVVETVGHRAIGINALKKAVGRAIDGDGAAGNKLRLGERLDRALEAIGGALGETSVPPERTSWTATKLLLDDPHFVEQIDREGAAGQTALAVAADERSRIEAETGRDISLFVTEQYHGFVDGLLRQVVRQQARDDARALSDRIDAILVHRWLGVPFFLAAMYGVFWITFTVGELPMSWLERGSEALAAGISGLWPAGSTSPLRSLLVDGVIGGVGGVLAFLPNIVLLFGGLALLEDTGYMARAAFLMDRLMHGFGLHGRSFIPLMTGFGCSVPGIMATRTLEHEHDRLTTMLVLPLMSCGARLTIWMLLIPAFFAPGRRAGVLFALYAGGVLLALLLALLLRRTVLRGEEAPFVMELPPYRLPTIRAVGVKMAERSWIYLRKAGTIILAFSVLLWFATSYPKPEQHAVDTAAAGTITAAELGQRRATENLRYSAAGRIGSALEPLLQPMGLDWKVGIAMVGAFAAKEVFVAQMGIVYSIGEGEDSESADRLRRALRRDYSPLAGVALMIFLLIGTPCIATLAITRRESGSWKWPLLQFGGLTLIAYLAAVACYQVGRLLGGAS